MNRRLIFILLLFILAGCQPTSNNTPQNQETLTVSAAISLKDAFGEIGNLYKSKTGKSVNFNFGASGALQKQIETGAPVDIFAGAGEKQMDELAAKNLIDPATRRDFARNTLVLIVPQNSKLGLEDFSTLSKPDVTKIAVGNPKTVPAGQYAEQFFETTNLKSSVQSKLILAENVRQVLDYVVRDETDAGIVYGSDALSAGEKVRVVATVPENTHDSILYPIALVKNGEQKQGREFLDFVLSAEGQSVLRKYGFAGASQK